MCGFRLLIITWKVVNAFSYKLSMSTLKRLKPKYVGIELQSENSYTTSSLLTSN